MRNKHLCDCTKVAIYFYMPATDKEFGNRYFCTDCVPRGCSCNHYHVEELEYEGQTPTEDDKPFIWVEENKVWTHVDDQGRQYPCVEYDYEENGYDVYTEEEIDKMNAEWDAQLEKEKLERLNNKI